MNHHIGVNRHMGVNHHMAPVSRKLAPDCRDAGARAMPGAIAEVRCGWTPGWTEIHSLSYGLKEAQVKPCMNKPEPGNWHHMVVKYA